MILKQDTHKYYLLSQKRVISEAHGTVTIKVRSLPGIFGNRGKALGEKGIYFKVTNV